MTSEQFCFWLQGMFEVTEPKTLNEHQTELVKKHLELVFIHEIGPTMTKKKPELQEIHDRKLPDPPHGWPHSPRVYC